METVEAELTTIFQVQDFLRCFLLISSFEPWRCGQAIEMKLARRRAAERLDMTPMQLMNQHNMRQEKERKLAASSRELSHLALIGAPFWAHFTRGDPYAEFQRDKGLLGRRRVATAPSQMPTATEPISKVDSRVKKSITGTFEYINFRPPPAHLAWGQSSTQVPFPDLSAVVEASRCLQRPKSDSLITVQLPEPLAERKARPRGATSNICLGLHRNSYERIKL